jgi:hypothetical protein
MRPFWASLHVRSNPPPGLDGAMHSGLSGPAPAALSVALLSELAPHAANELHMIMVLNIR